MISNTNINIPLKHQLILVVASITVIATVLFAYLNGTIQNKLVYKEYNSSAQIQLEAVRLGLEIGLREENFESISEVFSWATRNQNIDYILIYDEYQELLASYPDTIDSENIDLSETPRSFHKGSDRFVKQIQWFSSISGNGQIYMVFNTDYIKDSQKEANINLTFLTILIAIGASFCAYVVAKNITKPVESLKRVAENSRLKILN